MMEHDSQVLLDLEEGALPLPRVMVSRTKAGSSKSGVWRVCGVFLAVTLCAAAAVCFTLNKSQSNQESGTGLQLKTRDHLSQASFTSKAAIHLTGGYDHKHPTNTIDWKVNQDQAFSSGGLELVKNEIIIPFDGIYFVYTQVSFHISCVSDRTEDNIVHLSHAVFRFSDSYGSYKPLFSALRSACVHAPDTDDLSYNTIYLGAAFQLRGGDRLHTQTTPKLLLPRIENENGKTFFGVFAL